MSSADHFGTLGLRPGASEDQIRKAFRRLALIHHPDKNPGDAQAAARFRRIAEAYRILSDSETRGVYERTRTGRNDAELHPEPFLKIELDTESLYLNGELGMTVYFPSEGRAFRKPALDGWEIAAGPAVSHRMQNGYRETVLHYTLSPLRTGRLTIPSARIQFHGKFAWSEPREAEVLPNTCWFTHGETAGRHPYRLRLYKLHDIRSARLTKTVVVPRTVLIPRSDLAAYYHRVGRTLKIVVPLLSAPLAVLQGFPLLLGFLAGSLFAGLNVRLMYRLMGIKPVSNQIHRFPAVISRLDEGYFFGNSPPLWSGSSRTRRFRLRDWLL